MKKHTLIESQSDSLMDILAAQCVDLEKLLALAQQETSAASAGNFEEIMRIVAERATLGDRLEVYHRQLAELRSRFEHADDLLNNDSVRRAAQLIAGIQAQDAHTRPLLAARRDETSSALARLHKSRRGLNSYLRDGRANSAACDQLL